MNYTIIIPHSNIPNLLKRCVTSIPERKDIEVIVVDDSSNIKLEEKFIFSNLNFGSKLLLSTPKVLGAGYARNLGLKKASGKWIIFADADDLFTKDAFVIFDSYLESSYETIYFGTESVFSDTLISANRHLYYMNLVSNFNKNDLKSINKLKYNFGVPWAKMIRHSTIKNNHIRFDEIMCSNDVMFSTKLGYYSKKIYADIRSVYCVTVRSGSLVHTISKKTLLTRYNVAISQNMFLKNIDHSNLRKSLTPYIRQSSKFGINFFLKFIIIAIYRRANIFIGFSNWPRSIYFLLKEYFSKK